MYTTVCVTVCVENRQIMVVMLDSQCHLLVVAGEVCQKVDKQINKRANSHIASESFPSREYICPF